MTAEHLFLDESKSDGYVAVVSAVVPVRLAEARRDLRGLVLRGQSRLHFYKESPARRRLILAAIAGTGARSTVYSAAGYRHDSDARAACLAGVVADAAAAGAHLLVLEQDDSILHWDRRHLFNLTRAAGTALRYEHQQGRSEPLLWVPDAIAWCWARGGQWRELATPLIDQARDV